MSTRRLVVLITFMAVFAMAARPSLDSDTWWHLRAGQWIIENRAIPQVDPFSYTRLGASWQYPGWLVEVPMYWIYEHAGPAGLNLWTALVVTLAFIFIYRTLSGGVFLRAFIVILSAAASAIYWAARPYLITFLFAAIYLWILENYRWRSQVDPVAKRRLGWLPVLMMIWANSHGGFIVGFILVGIYVFDELLRWLIPWTLARFGSRDENRSILAEADSGPEDDKAKSKMISLLLIVVFMVFAVCLNPSGPVMLWYPFKTVSVGALSQYIQEWQPPNFHSAQVQPFVWMILITFGVTGASRRRLALTDFLLFAGFVYLSFNAARNIALFALASAPVLSRYADSLLEELSLHFGFEAGNGRPARAICWLNCGIFILIGLAVVAKAVLACSPDANRAEISKTMPVEAVNFIAENKPPGRLFNSYNWGGYLLYELTDYPVFIDGRTDLYDDKMVNEWLQIMQARPGYREALDRWGVRLVLVEPGVPLVSTLMQEGWKLVYQDQIALVLER